MDPLISFLIIALVVCLIVVVALYVLREIGPPDPMAKIIRVIIIVVACIYLLTRGLPLLGVSI
jgi:uncharacterized membrane protein